MAEAAGRASSVRMTQDEAWGFVEGAVTGILTTLRADGRPVALPVWFVVIDRRVYVQTRGKKVLRARHDSRCSFLVEGGERWAELRAVHLECTVRVVDEPDGALAAQVAEAMDNKYRSLRTAQSDMPSDTRAHYHRSMGALLVLEPGGRMLTWDNRRLGIS